MRIFAKIKIILKFKKSLVMNTLEVKSHTAVWEDELSESKKVCSEKKCRKMKIGRVAS